MKATTKLIIILIGIILIGLFIYDHFEMKSQLEKANHNVSELIKENKQNKTFYPTQDQFEEMLENYANKLIAELRDSLNIKPKHIVKTYTNTYHHHYKDTIIHAEKKDSSYYATFEPDSCLKVDVKFSLVDEAFTFSNPIVDYKSATIHFWSRQTKKGKKIIWPFGKKKLIMKTINKCEGETTTEEIIIQK